MRIIYGKRAEQRVQKQEQKRRRYNAPGGVSLAGSQAQRSRRGKRRNPCRKAQAKRSPMPDRVVHVDPQLMECIDYDADGNPTGKAYEPT